MDPVAAKYIGAGIACLGMGLAGVGVGNIFANFLGSALRNPSAAQGQFGNLIFGFAVTEALGIFSLLIALLLVTAVIASFQIYRIYEREPRSRELAQQTVSTVNLTRAALVMFYGLAHPMAHVPVESLALRIDAWMRQAG